ncbi:MAG: phosphoethanolamine transferase [Neisseriaceae bacterium]|nr:phosphoethanolamine transferase [Neisseriaceae bacterium]MBP6863380.1 phosphoethanolamine transferase [Neisseriaceae bacterium]
MYGFTLNRGRWATVWQWLLPAAVMSTVLFGSEVLFRLFTDVIPMYKAAETWAFLLLLCVVMLKARSKWTVAMLGLFFGVGQIGHALHYAVYHTWLSPTAYLLLFDNLGEVSETGLSILPRLWAPLAWSVLETAAFLSLIWLRPKVAPKRWLWDAVWMMVLASTIISGATTKHVRGLMPAERYSRLKANYYVTGHLFGQTLPGEWFSFHQLPEYKRPEPKVVAEPKLPNIIWIMGESQNTTHMSVFGYDRPTTPFLQQLKQQPNAVVKESFSAGISTDVSIPSLFNLIERADGTEQARSGDSNLYRLAKLQGYQTAFYSAQARNGLAFVSLVGSFWIDDYTDSSDHGYDTLASMRDDALLPQLAQLDLTQGRHFVVLHQRGAHSPFGDSLRDDERPFGTATVTDRYDNAVLDTDAFIEGVVKQLQGQPNQDWLLIYTADHGEYIKGEKFGHVVFDPEVYEVPVVIMSPNKALQQSIQSRLKGCDRLMHKQLPTLVLETMGFDVPMADCEHSVVNGGLMSGRSGQMTVEQKGQSVVLKRTS